MAQATPLEIAYRYLGTRERTVAEVQERLIRAGVGSGELAAVIEELVHLGSLDDARYARLFVEDKRVLEGWGKGRISRELTRRGVSRSLIDAALTGAGEDDGTELERAVTVLQRRFGGPFSDRRERERALGVLLRKGYDSELALDAVRAFDAG